MEIRIMVVNEYGKVLEEMGNCVTNNISGALQMYEDDAERWDNAGYCASIAYELIS
jgi:hypothetical protein